MIKLLFISPNESLGRKFSQIFNEHHSTVQQAEYNRDSFELEVKVVRQVEEIENLALNADVVVSRGFFTLVLQRKEYFIPVVDLPLAAGDVVRSIQKAISLYNPERIAIVGSANMVMGANGLSDIFGREIRQYIIQQQNEIIESIKQIKADGIDTVVGGTLTNEYAAEYGLNSVTLDSERESIWYSITQAKRLAYISRQEQLKGQNLLAVFNSAVEGIITIDKDNRIEVLNLAAGRILNLSPALTVGRLIDEVLTDPGIKNILSKPENIKNELIKHNESPITISSSPITIRGEVIGRLLIVQEIAQIQALESKIRKKIYQRGHIAHNTFRSIIGSSTLIHSIIEKAKKYSLVDSNILIVGETGTGKELFAQSIHNHSPRKHGPFVAVNCAALPESLLESELFGYEKGAFTGASKDGKPGLFEQAHLGTLFLDEISEIPHPLQGRLLRAIQEKEIRRLGDDRVIPVDVRIISASNRDLYQLTAEQSFREDLYYRLDILKLMLPSLRERKDDIQALLEFWLKEYGLKFKNIPVTMTPQGIEQLRQYSWPGNIRQLKNICERLVVLTDSSIIRDSEVNEILGMIPTRDMERFQAIPAPGISMIDMLEKEQIYTALAKCSFNKHKAAEHLGISRSTLWRKIKRLEVL